MSQPNQLVQKLWNYCNILRDDGLKNLLNSPRALILWSLVSASVVCATLDLRAATLHVPTQYTNIQAAIDSAGSGDIVLVAPGVYPGNVNFNGKAITVTSEHGPAQTVIRANDNDYVVVFATSESTNSVLRGFTIEHAPGVGGLAVGIYDCSPTIVGNIFQNNTHNDIRLGSAIECEGVFRDTFPIIEGNIFRNNAVPSNSFYRFIGAISCFSSASPRIRNNLFISNSCPAICFALRSGKTPLVLNNTFVGNTVGICEDGSVNNSTHLFANNVFFCNSIGCEVAAPYPKFANNLFYRNGFDLKGADDQIGLNGNIRGNPLFSCPLAGDFRLLPGSGCIDAGTNLVPELPPYDFLGFPRIMAGVSNGPAVVDIGANEFNPIEPNSPCLFLGCGASSTQQCGVASSLTVVASQSAGAAMTVAWSVNGVMIKQDVIPAGDPPTVTNLFLTLTFPLGTNRVEVIATDSLSNVVNCSSVITVVDTIPPILECSNRTVSAVGDAGARVFFVLQATDLCEGILPVTCVPPSGSIFPNGTNAVMCNAVDRSGNSSQCSFTVAVLDPIQCPGDVVTEFTRQAGANISFTVPGLNPPSTGLQVVCVPSPGSLFPVGTNTVVCGVTDDTGNRNQCTFTVVVLGTRGVELDVLNQMLVFRNGMEPPSIPTLDQAIQHLSHSRATNFWIGEAHLKTRNGAHVFQEQARTVRLLIRLLARESDQSRAETLHSLIERLVRTGQILAIVELQDAIAAGATQKQLEGAIKSFIKGDSATVEQSYEKAIRHYQSAWLAGAHRTDRLSRNK